MAVDGRAQMSSVLIWVPVQRAHITVGANEAGGIQDPAFNQGFESGQFPRIEITGSAQSMQITICIKTKF